MPKATRLAGIVAVGGSHAQAVENFRNTATGVNAMFYQSESGVVYASQSSVDLFDPKGGNTLLEENAELVAKAEFKSESSAENVKANYHICLDGCLAHIVSDSSAEITHCPSCSASLEEITDERIVDHMENENKDAVSRSSVVAVGATVEEAQAALTAAIKTQNVVTALSSATSFIAITDGVKFDPYSSLAISESRSGSNEISSLSNGADKLEAHVYSCSASCELPFTIATDDDTVFCAHCSAPLIDIESNSGSEEDDASDIIDEEELEDEEEEDEDFDSESSNEDDEEFDDEEEEEEDEEFDDEEDDEDDFDDEELEEDEDFDSESSASEDDDEEEDDEEDYDEDDEDEFEDDEDEDDFGDEEDSESSVRSLSGNVDAELQAEVRSFDSLSAAKAEHGNLDPNLVSLSRTQSGRVPSVFLNYDGVPVARATFSSFSAAAGEDSARRVFDGEDFIRAVSKSVHVDGVDATCKNFGFEPFVMQLSVSKMLTAEADARVESASSSVNGTVSELVDAHRERFVSALSTAMLGVSRNFWRDANNPIVESLCATLRGAGIADPRPIVERAFINNGKDFLHVALSHADALMAKFEVAQNEIAEAVAQAAGVIRNESAPKVPSVSKDSEDNLEEIESESSARKTDDFDARLARRFGNRRR